ncbi:MAG: U32 family peptidase [Deltaproteobacteria bacterium]|nr:U32 family peptidase [Deltaproteobacteria bacterium]
MRKIELLSPAGSLSKMNVSFRYGADAVYIGGKAFNLRARSSNFSQEDLREASSFAHKLGKKVYVALNILAHDREIKALPRFVKFLEEIGIDAVIVADLGILDLVQEHSQLRIHISTQASATNWRSVKMYERLGAKRVVLAREVSIPEIRKIKDAVPDMELEVFVHGAMCMTYSGRCNLSQYFSERDGNRGVCSNTCRWKYHIVEEKRPGEFFPVYEDETGTYIYNSKDLCSIEFLDKLLDAGVDGLKIEGRMKSHYYCANATKIYRQALDSYLSGTYTYDPQWRRELEKMSHRGYTSGFYLGKLDKESEQQKGETFASHHFAGLVREKLSETEYLMESRERFDLAKDIEILRPFGQNERHRISRAINQKTGEEVQLVQPNMMLKIQVEVPLAPFDILTTDQKLIDSQAP